MTKTAPLTKAEEKADTNGDGRLTLTERVTALEGRFETLVKALAGGDPHETARALAE